MIIDTHTHLDGKEFADDLSDVIARAKAVGVGAVFIPAIDLPSLESVQRVCRAYPGYAFPMLGLHPEEVKDDYAEVLSSMKAMLTDVNPFIAIGEVGLDYYWSREYESQQLAAFEEQVQWSVATRLPLMIHCRKGQNEMVKILRRYQHDLPGGVFHCFTGNSLEAAELLSFGNFVLGIGGVLTFRKSHLPEVVRDIPLFRIVLETDSPYMAPVPMRGKRNESAFLTYVIDKLAESYQISADAVCRATTENVRRVFVKFRDSH